jgi:homoprotocatechuate degradation regulator HpaR
MPRPISRRNLPLLLLQAREAVIAHFRPILQHFGLTEQQWRIVRALEEEGELEPWQLSERCQILKPSLTGVLARMEDLGLVERRRVASDQRRWLVRGTRRSHALLTRMAPLVEAQYRHLEEALGAEQVSALYAALDRLLASPHDRVRGVALGAAARARRLPPASRRRRPVPAAPGSARSPRAR